MKRVKTGRTRQTRLEIARYLMLRYAPEVELEIKPGGADRLLFDERTGADPKIIFDPREGLTLLLHELGHWNTLREIKDCSTIEEEAVAWAWAERCARRENLWFDYNKAESCFEGYMKPDKKRRFWMPLQMQWAYR